MTRKKELSVTKMNILEAVVAKHASLLELALCDFKELVCQNMAEHELSRARDIACHQNAAHIESDSGLCTALGVISHAGACLHDHLQNGVVMSRDAHRPNENKITCREREGGRQPEKETKL